MYYSTPGALKVQGLAARKVTAGSPLNSCKLSTGSGEAGAESAGAWLLGGSPSAASPPHGLEGILVLDAGNGRGQRLYSYMARPL